MIVVPLGENRLSNTCLGTYIVKIRYSISLVFVQFHSLPYSLVPSMTLSAAILVKNFFLCSVMRHKLQMEMLRDDSRDKSKWWEGKGKLYETFSQQTNTHTQLGNRSYWCENITNGNACASEFCAVLNLERTFALLKIQKCQKTESFTLKERVQKQLCRRYNIQWFPLLLVFVCDRSI